MNSDKSTAVLAAQHILPKGWRWAKLGEVCELCQYGLTATASNDGEIPYIRITDIDDFGNIKIDGIKFIDCEENTYKKYEIEEGDILFARSGSIGRTFLYSGIPQKAVFASYLIRFRLNQEFITPAWLFYYTHSSQYYQFIENKKHTVSQPNINAQEYKSLIIPLPSLSTQHRIAAKIKELMDEVEHARESCEKQLEAAKALPAAYLREVFESKEAKKWERKRLGEVCELIMGQSPPGDTYTYKPEGLPFFQGKTDFGEYFPRVRVWCRQPRKIAEEGYILITVRAPVGPVNMSNLKCCVGRGLAGIRCKDNITINWFIFRYLRFIENKITSLGNGSTFNAITRSDLENLNIPLPPIEDQRRIASKLKEKMAEVENLKSKIYNQQSAIEALPQAILRKAFRGEL